jgi:hypothetical protein
MNKSGEVGVAFGKLFADIWVSQYTFCISHADYGSIFSLGCSFYDSSINVHNII